METLANLNNREVIGSQVTVSGYLVKKPEEPLEDGYNYPFIDNNDNGILVKSKAPLNHIQAGKWSTIHGKINSDTQLEMNLVAASDVQEAKDQPKPPSLSRQFSSTVKKVVDGDTIHLQTPVLGATKVRLVSIDTPETNYQGDSQGYYGEEATRILKDLLKEGEQVGVRVGDEAFDQYGRLLAVVMKEEQNINQEMIANGLAVPYFIYPNLRNFVPYGNTVVRAKECGKGIWDSNRPINELPYEFRFNKRGGPNKYVGNYQTKCYVMPKEWESVPIEDRVFFLQESDAIQAGYKEHQEDTTCK